MNIHYIQRLILMDLAESDKLSFSDFKRALKEGIEKDSLNYHLKTLISKKYVKKDGKSYNLTYEGKRYISNLDFERKKPALLPKISVMVGVFRETEGKTQILLAKRLKSPFLGSYSLFTGKVNWGEPFVETAKREVFEETCLAPTNAELIGFRRLIDTDETTGELLIDVIFAFLKVTEFTGELMETTEESVNVWVDIDKTEEYQILPAAKEFVTKDFANWDHLPFKESFVQLGKF